MGRKPHHVIAALALFAPFFTSCLMPSQPRSMKRNWSSEIRDSAPSAAPVDSTPATELPPTDDRLGASRADGVMDYRCHTRIGAEVATRQIRVQNADQTKRSELDSRGLVALESSGGTLSVIAVAGASAARAQFALGNASLEFQRGATHAQDAVDVSCRRLSASGEEASRAVDPVRPTRTLTCKGVLRTRDDTASIDVAIPGLGSSSPRKRYVVAETRDWVVEVWSDAGRLSIDLVHRLDAKTYFSSQLFGANPLQNELVGLQAPLPGTGITASGQAESLTATCRF